MNSFTRFVLLALSVCCSTLVVACGSSSSPQNADASKDIQAFIGTWAVTSGTVTLDCGGQITTAQVTDPTTWMKGTTSDLVQPPDSSGCALQATVSGRTATAEPNQTCSQQAAGNSVVITLAMYTFVVGSDQTTASEQGMGTAVVKDTTTRDCTYSEKATYKKSSP